jgi:hypothetical protein
MIIAQIFIIVGILYIINIVEVMIHMVNPPKYVYGKIKTVHYHPLRLCIIGCVTADIPYATISYTLFIPMIRIECIYIGAADEKYSVGQYMQVERSNCL